MPHYCRWYRARLARGSSQHSSLVTLQAWGSAALLVAASVLVGCAFNQLGMRCRAAAPAVGLSALIVIAAIAIKLPGRAVTAAVVLLIVLVACAVVVVRDRVRIRVPLLGLLTGVVAALGAAIPFIANGYVGLLGVSLSNDTATHLRWAEGLRSPVVAARYGLEPGYPLGPHSLVDAVASGVGVRLDLAFTGLLIAIVVIAALVASAGLRGESAWKRLLAGAVGSLLYLLAAYYAEGQFKEPLMGVLLLAMVLHLEELGRGWGTTPGGRLLGLIPVALLVAAGVYVYSYPALAWFGLTLAIWAMAEAVVHPSWLRPRRFSFRTVGAPVAGAALLFIAVLAPSAGRIINFVGTIGTSPAANGAITTSNVGNLAHALSPYEALGIWNSPDFRFFPANVFHAGELSALALGVLLIGVAWSLGRRELLLPAAVFACAIVYWRSSHTQSIYVTAKALVIAGPVVAVTGLRGLLSAPRVPLPRWVSLPRLLVAAVFLPFAVHSSLEALRNEPVWAPESTNELLSLDATTRGQTVLFLGASDYAAWLFHDSKMSTLAVNSTSMAQASPSPTKPNVYGTAFDFDSVDASSLNRFRWVITTDTDDASQAPGGFRLVRQLRMYQLWKRVGLVPAREALDPPGAPGTVLSCRTRAGRQLSRRRGVAAVMTPPVAAPLTTVLPGSSEQTSLRLPPGNWDLSLQYESPVNLELTGSGHHWAMPAYTDRPGPVFAVGRIRSDGSPIVVTIRASRPSSLTGPDLSALPTELIAVHSPAARTLIPLGRSCGRYVDWYRIGA